MSSSKDVTLFSVRKMRSISCKSGSVPYLERSVFSAVRIYSPFISRTRERTTYAQFDWYHQFSTIISSTVQPCSLCPVVAELLVNRNYVPFIWYFAFLRVSIVAENEKSCDSTVKWLGLISSFSCCISRDSICKASYT
jgi:hypothetical protein